MSSSRRFTRALPILAAVVLSGCVTLGPSASPTPPPTAAPTASPAPTTPPTAPPTEPPTAPPTEPPTAPPTEPPTAPPATPAPTSSPTNAELDPNQDARYGLDDDVNAGFAPDPLEVAVVSGGTVDVSYLGGACVGFAAQNPDLQVHYVAGAATMLRFYFVADTPGDDAVLIINDTTSQWHCNDDYSGSTHDPSIEFSPPVGGYYDVWIGSYRDDDFISGTLYITELTFNHP